MTYPVQPSLHPLQSSVILSHSRLFTPAITRSRSTLSLKLNFGIHLFSLPHCSIYLPCSLYQSFLTYYLDVSSPSQSASNYTVILVFVHSDHFSSFHIIYLLVSLYIFSEPNCFLLSLASPPVSLPVQVFLTYIHKLVQRRLPKRCPLAVSSTFCPI